MYFEHKLITYEFYISFLFFNYKGESKVDFCFFCKFESHVLEIAFYNVPVINNFLLGSVFGHFASVSLCLEHHDVVGGEPWSNVFAAKMLDQRLAYLQQPVGIILLLSCQLREHWISNGFEVTPKELLIFKDRLHEFFENCLNIVLWSKDNFSHPNASNDITDVIQLIYFSVSVEFL